MNKSDLYLRITALFTRGLENDAQRVVEENRAALSQAEILEIEGNEQFYKRKYQESVPLYEAAMEGDAEYDCARYHYLIGVQKEQTHQFVSAFERYQAAIEIEPTFVDAYVELGGLMCKVGDFKGALQCYSDANKIDPTDAGIQHNLIQVLTRLAKSEPSVYGEALERARLSALSTGRDVGPQIKDHVW